MIEVNSRLRLAIFYQSYIFIVGLDGIFLSADRLTPLRKHFMNQPLPAIQQALSFIFRNFTVTTATFFLLWTAVGSAQGFQQSGPITEKRKDAQEKSPQELLEKIILLGKQHSLYRSGVDWPKLATKIRLQLGNGDSIEELAVPVQEMLFQLGDYHGAVLIRGKRFMASRKGKGIVRNRKKGLPMDVKIVPQIVKRSLTADTDVFTKMLPGRIAYVEIPTINATMDQIDALATKIRKAIQPLLAQDPKGLIVDLRTNLGGNMHPMFAGLGRIFPNLEMGGQTRDGKTIELSWSLKAGNVFLAQQATTSLPSIKNSMAGKLPVAVLVSRYTCSSGEAVASGLYGQKGVRLFDEHTSGFSTSNDWFTLSEDVFFSPATGYYISQNRITHLDGITPHEEIQEVLNLKDLTTGKTVHAAIQWIETAGRQKKVNKQYR